MLRRRLIHDERGIALLMALGILIVLAIVVTASVQYTTANTRSSASSEVRLSVRQISEAGMNAAVGSLAASPTSSTDLPSTQATARTLTLPGGTASYWGTFDSSTDTWTLNSVGSSTNPDGGTATGTATNQLKATVAVSPSPLVQATPAAAVNPWAFMWSTRTGTACDETINQSVGVPLVVLGDLCLDATGTAQTGITSGPLYVKAGGSTYALWNKNIHAKISGATWTSGLGTAISGGAHLSGNMCKNSYNGTTGSTVHACTKSLSTAGDNVYSTADSIITGLGTITPPTADFAGYYTKASPGPSHPCNASLSTGAYPAATVFENEATSPTRNNSVTSVFNLTPHGSAYDCVVGSSAAGSGSCSSGTGGAGSGQSYGEISWDGTSKLQVRGTVYVDGSVSISNAGPTPTTIVYSCYGSIYASGTILMNNTYLCGQWFDPGCNNTVGLTGFWSFFSGWLPFAEWDFLVADGDGGAGGASSQGGLIPAGVGIKMINSRFQGGLYATNAIEFDANSNFEGPAIGSNLIFDGTFASAWGTGWQSANCGSCSTMPSGTPGIAQTSKTQVSPPVYG
ncbi:MAG TPA: pilus assembly PilX N-terminal domain-containing protein [Gaiellaceae bacterium]|nr:pilus assembly PilX N-terminal domain-containing protein [Gaiellaceae bacterium]